MLNIGGIDYDVGAYEHESGQIQVFDSSGPQCDDSGGCSFAFSEQVETCENGECFFTSDRITNFLFGSLSVTALAVPEPGTLSLFLLGLLGVGGARKKWRSGRDSNPRPPA